MDYILMLPFFICTKIVYSWVTWAAFREPHPGGWRWPPLCWRETGWNWRCPPRVILWTPPSHWSEPPGCKPVPPRVCRHLQCLACWRWCQLPPQREPEIKGKAWERDKKKLEMTLVKLRLEGFKWSWGQEFIFNLFQPFYIKSVWSCSKNSGVFPQTPNKQKASNQEENENPTASRATFLEG